MTSLHTHTLDGAALRRAFSDRDAETLTSLYADDATIEVADAQTTPSSPLEVQGRDAIRAYFEDVGPEARRHGAARVLAGMQREPGQECPRAAARRHGEWLAVDLGLQLAEEPHAQHEGKPIPALTVA